MCVSAHLLFNFCVNVHEKAPYADSKSLHKGLYILNLCLCLISLDCVRPSAFSSSCSRADKCLSGWT